MKRMIMAMALGTALLAAAACGDDGGGDSGAPEEFTLADYFSAYDDIITAAGAQGDSIAFPDFDGSDATLDESKSALATFLEENRDLARKVIAEFEDIDPPDEARALHEDLLEVFDDYGVALDGYIADVEDLDSIPDVVEFDLSDLDALGGRRAAICTDLQRLADDEAIDVELSCE